MRQRSVKNREAKIQECSRWQASDPKALKGRWAEAFTHSFAPVFIEIGSGKGKFICETAAKHPENNYIAAEGGTNIAVRILQKAREMNLDNLLVITSYIEDIRDFFEEGELSGIFINFCDPWPKDRHYKRRLTYRGRLEGYRAVSRPGAVLQLKTDNDGLFDFSLEEIRAEGLKLRWVTRALHDSPYGENNICTEYEEKFSAAGKNINALQAILR